MVLILKIILTLFIFKWIYIYFKLIFDYNYRVIYLIKGSSRFQYGILDVLGIVSLILLYTR